MYGNLELLDRGSASRVRLLRHRPNRAEKNAELTDEWNCVADGGDCQALVVDCSTFDSWVVNC